MKKLLIAVPLIAVAGGVAAPFVIGSKIESATKQQIALSNQQLEKALAANPQISNAKVELESYEKGYLDATATGKIDFSINLGPEGAKAYSIPFTSEVKHGPYLGDAGFGASSVVTRPDLSGFDLPDAINKDTVVIKTLVGFAGDIKNDAIVAPIVFEKDGTNFDFGGAVISSLAPKASNQATFTGDVTVKELKVVSANGEFLLKPFTMDIESEGQADFSNGTYEGSSSAIEGAFDGGKASFVLQKLDLKGGYKQAKGTDLLPLTNTDLTLHDITIQNESLPEPIKLPKLGFTTLVEQNNGTDLDIFAKYNVELDPSLLKIMNSPVDVKTADVAVKIKGVSLDAVEQYQAMVKDLMESGGQDQQAAQAFQGKALGIFQSLVKNASAANIEVNAKAVEGDLAADVDVGFKPNLTLSETELMGLLASPNPSQLLSILVGRGDVSLSKGITDKAGVTPMIQIMAADFVTLDGDTFKSDVKITDGQLLVNGQPLPMFGGM